MQQSVYFIPHNAKASDNGLFLFPVEIFMHFSVVLIGYVPPLYIVCARTVVRWRSISLALVLP
jgi:hypothetical protein